MTRLHLAALLTACALLAQACSSNPPPSDPTKDDLPDTTSRDGSATPQLTPPSLADVPFIDTDKQTRLVVALSDGSLDSGRIPPGPAAKTSAISAEQTQTLLSRLDPLTTEDEDIEDFAVRGTSLPAPRTGDTVEDAFPPAATRDVPDAAANEENEELEVLRAQPEGDVPLAPHISVTFNQPMIAISSHKDTVADKPPVTIDPMPPGQWRWVGTKTLLFEPEGRRFPMATTYTVTVPEGTTSTLDNGLTSAKTFSFTTPPVTIKRSWPTYSTHERDQLVFVEFDQKIDPEALLPRLQFKTPGIFGRVAAKLASDEEIAADEDIQRMLQGAQPERYVVLKSSETLPYDSSIRVRVLAGAPSAEGPGVTKDEQSFSFNTYGPFRLSRTECGWSRGCTPNDTFQIEMSNAIDPEAFDPQAITIEPEIPGANIYASGNWLTIAGEKPGRRTYTVTLPSRLQDTFGQTLEADKKVTFEVGAAQPRLYATLGAMTILDPSGEPTVTFSSVNYDEVRLKAWEVGPDDWGSFLEYYQNRYYGPKKSIPGKLIATKKIEIDSEPDARVDTLVTLTKELGEDALGNLVIQIVPTSTSHGASMPRNKPAVVSWIQATKLAIDGFVDQDEFLAWATSLATGAPLEGVEIEVRPMGASATTDATGRALVDLERLSASKLKQQGLLVAKKGSDLAFLPERFYTYGSTSWTNQVRQDELRWMLFDDRGMYRPKETVSVKGWLRVAERSEGGGLRLASGASKIDYQVYGPRGNEITKGSTSVKGLGGFDFTFELPDTPNLGWARVNMQVSGTSGLSNTSMTHRFQIQEFRRPEFEVKASFDEGPHFVGGEATATVDATYYAGGGLPAAETTWRVTTSTSSFSPPNQSDYTFGSWTPWWVSGGISRGFGRGFGMPSAPADTTETYKGTTDAIGRHLLSVDFDTPDTPRPVTVRAQATVIDVNRQAWSATATSLVHPSKHYVGLRSEKYFVEKGTPLEIFAVVADIDGERLAKRPLKVRAERMVWGYAGGQWKQTPKEAQDCEVETPDAAPFEVKCAFETDIGGSYRITATTMDDERRANFTQMTRWVSGGERPPARRVEQEQVQLIPDRDSYQPGDVARILVQSPFTPSHGLVTLRRQGIVEERHVTLDGSTMTLEVPIKEQHVPNLFVQVDLTGSAPRLDNAGKPVEDAPKRPAYAKGSIKLSVPPTKRVLDVAVTPASDKVDPGASTSVSVEVKDAQGEPVDGAEVAVVVVDESILSLSSYAMKDPLNIFYSERGAEVRDHHLRAFVRLVDPEVLRAELKERPAVPPAEPMLEEKTKSPARRMKRAEAAPGAQGLRLRGSGRGGGGASAGVILGASGSMDMEDGVSIDGLGYFGGEDASNKDSGGADGPQIAARTNFDPLAAFAPAVKTDASGKATVSIEMPDNLTRYRVMAVAVKDATNYGTSEKAITARLPLMVRPSPPRFLNFGDTFELPVVVQNQTDATMSVMLAARATNIELLDARGVRVDVPANDRVEVRLRATTANAGTARIQVAATADGAADAANVELPVWTPATSEAFATYGVIDAGAIQQPVKLPGEIYTQFGELEVTTSSTAMQALTDAFLYLQSYPYECSEQLSSRVLTVAALRDVLDAFDAEGMPTKAEVARAMRRDIDKVLSRQNYDGGFALWRKGQRSWPFVTIHVAHALARAEQKGYDVDADAMRRTKEHLRNIERYIPGWYSEWTRRTIIAYSLYVRAQLKDRDPAKARSLMRRSRGLDGLPFEATGWLLTVMTGDASSTAEVATIRKYLNNRVTETAGAAHFASSFSDGGHVIMHSDRRADGVVLEAMIEDTPKSDLIPKIVKGLMAHRKRGRWGNTQENAFVLLALDRYFNTYEKQTPDFVARAWIGETYAAEHTFKGRTAERHRVEIPLSYLAERDNAQTLTLQKDGKGRMYYRVGMNYAPKSLFLEPADHGFVIERKYIAVDDPEDVTRRDDGVWEIRAGAKVKVELTMVAPTRRYHVALVDPLPAGLEVMNPALATTGDLPEDPSASALTGGWWWYSRPWYEHQNVRDERVEAFSSLLWGGVHNYVYFARATTPGEFVVPPTKAEEMYAPETFGRSGSDRVVVK